MYNLFYYVGRTFNNKECKSCQCYVINWVQFTRCFSHRLCFSTRPFKNKNKAYICAHTSTSVLLMIIIEFRVRWDRDAETNTGRISGINQDICPSIWLFCYHFDPNGYNHGLIAQRFSPRGRSVVVLKRLDISFSGIVNDYIKSGVSGHIVSGPQH